MAAFFPLLSSHLLHLSHIIHFTPNLPTHCNPSSFSNMVVTVVALSPDRDFHFDSTPLSAPSSPKSFGYFYDHSSAPTSPTRASAFYAQFSLDTADFTFSFSAESEADRAVPADELFEAGKIRPLRSSGERGRHETSSGSSRSHKASRSLSPIRGGGVCEETPISSKPASTSPSTSDVKSSGSRRWRLRDLLLFRSASEGRATGRESKDPLRKYSPPLAPSTTMSKGGLAEIHYRANRAAYEEQKKKTALPYRRNGLFGYLNFNPAINSITRGINTRGRS